MKWYYVKDDEKTMDLISFGFMMRNINASGRIWKMWSYQPRECPVEGIASLMNLGNDGFILGQSEDPLLYTLYGTCLV